MCSFSEGVVYLTLALRSDAIILDTLHGPSLGGGGSDVCVTEGNTFVEGAIYIGN